MLSYYKIGYNAAKLLVNLLYKVSVDYQDEDALARIPKRDVVVYLMNHRSNADYIVVAYVLARGTHVSYAVGEWARAWPLEYVFKSFGAYFIRRRFREPLYHAVLERYVQLITTNGVTQGIFPEGGLTRDGRLRPPKLGLLDYICRSVLDPAFERDMWFVPVALNYDRVLEDRSLIRELTDPRDRPGLVAQLATVTSYVLGNTAPARDRAAQALWPRRGELRHSPAPARLARHRAARRAGVAPGTPPPRAAASGRRDAAPHRRDHPRDARAARRGRPAVVRADRWSRRDALLERMDTLRDRLLEVNGKVVRGGARIEEVWDRAWRMLRLRRLVVAEGTSLVILPRGRPLLEYYANSIAHLVPIRAPRLPFHKEHDRETDLPRLKTGEWGVGSGT